MKLAALLTVILVAACSPEPRRAFPVGFQGPVASRVAAEAARLGLTVSDQPPAGAAIETAAAPGAKAGEPEVAADWATLRFLAARAAVKGAGGVFFRLPSAPEGRDLLDYLEEWQAPVRALRELQAMRPILEGGLQAAIPFVVPPGVEARAWSYQGRQYVLLVNPSAEAVHIDAENLAQWRVLFEVRSDARHVLSPCGSNRCLPGRSVLWLEGRFW